MMHQFVFCVGIFTIAVVLAAIFAVGILKFLDFCAWLFRRHDERE